MSCIKMQPKFNFDKSKRKYVALKEFTDRELPQEAFIRNIEKLSENLSEDKEVFQILTYYGVGGIGKTTLKNKLKETVNDMSNAISLEVDFKNIRSRECAGALLELISSKSQKIRFPHFELAYAIFFKKKNPDYSFAKDSDSITDKFDLGIEILSILDPLGVVGVSKTIINKIYKQSGKIFLDRDLKEDLINLGNLSLSEIEERLPAYFAYDLKKHLDKTNSIKAVIFMDTFEALSEYETNELKKITKETWIQELIKSLPNVLFAIFGREKIVWESCWNEFLDQHILSELSTEYTNKFLEICGIKEKEIRDKIVNSSKGHPYYLDLSVDTYFSIKNSGEIPSEKDFGNSTKEILKRFIYNLDNIEIEMLKIMSVPNYFNYDIFLHLIKNFVIPYPITQFNSFNQYSFITKHSSLDKYYIHQLMREGMNDYIDEELKHRVNVTLFEYFETKYNQSKKNYLFECIYHKLRISDKNDFFLWLSRNNLEFLTTLQLLGETTYLCNVFGEIRKKYQISDFNTDVFNIYEDMIHLSGCYQESVAISEEFLKSYTNEEIFSQSDLIKLKFRIIHHKMFYIDADSLIEELIEIRDKIDEKIFFEEYCEILYMISGGVGFLTGDLDNCNQGLNNLKELIEKNISNNSKLSNIHLRTIRKIIDYNRTVGNIEVASLLCKQYLQEDNTNRYQIYLLCSYGEVLRAEANYNDAKKCFERVLAVTKQLGIKGWIAHAYLSLANLNLSMNDYAKAKNYNDNAHIIYNEISQQWGLINSNILTARISLCADQNIEKAKELLQETLKISTKYNYRYEMALINQILSTKEIGMQQLLYV
jgi:hypothetical protein